MPYNVGVRWDEAFDVSGAQKLPNERGLPESVSSVTSPDMATDREYVDLKLEAAEARTESRFVELNAKLDRLLDGLAVSQGAIAATSADVKSSRAEASSEARSTRVTIIVTTLATGIALASLLLAVMTYGDAIFSRGMNVRDVVNAAVKDQAERSQPSPVTKPSKAAEPKSGQ